MTMAVVTISRVLGSGGDDIAAKVAERLGYELVDNALIVKVAERAGVSVENAASFDEKYQSRVYEWLLSFIEPRIGKILTNGGTHLDPQMYVEYCKTVILGLAETDNIIIVGRAGQFILKDFETAFHVRIVADKSYRIARIMEKRGISEKDALEVLKKSDSMKQNYIERYLKADWGDPSAYHLIINSAKLGTSLSASIISETIEEFGKKLVYIPGIRDRRHKHDRRKTERRKGDRRTTDVGISHKELAHAVLRDGRSTRVLTKPDRRKSERRVVARRSADLNGSKQ